MDGSKYDWRVRDYVPVWRAGGRTERVVLRIIDTSANEPERTSGSTVAESFQNHGISCVDAYKKNRDAGINAIHEALKVRTDWGSPGLVVFNTCPTVKQNFMNYIWDRHGSTRNAGLLGEKQQPVKNNDDFIDLIRYMFQARLSYRMLKTHFKDPRLGRDIVEGGRPLGGQHGRRLSGTTTGSREADQERRYRRLRSGFSTKRRRHH
jgi:hypothetical protein